jgi:hypothetical protein
MAQMTCTDCFNAANCSWSFASGLCVDGDVVPLPFPLSMVRSTIAFCGPMETCLKDINPQDDHYKSLIIAWQTLNNDAINSLSECLSSNMTNCTGTTWDNAAYTDGCTAGNKSAVAEICDYTTTSTWSLTNMVRSSLLKLRRILSSSSSSSSSSAVSSSSSAVSPSSSSSAVSPSSSSSAVSSSVVPSSSSSPSTNKTFSFEQKYCIPFSCSAQIAAHFTDIWQDLLNFTLPTTTIPVDTFQCQAKPTPKPSKGLSGGAIAGIVIGCLVGVLLLGFLGWNMCGKSREPNEFQAM